MKIRKIELPSFKNFEIVNIKKSHDKKFFNPHIHNFFELIFIIGGKGKISIDFKELKLEKDFVYFIKPPQIHDWLIKEFNNEYDGYILLFSNDIIADEFLINELFLILTLQA